MRPGAGAAVRGELSTLPRGSLAVTGGVAVALAGLDLTVWPRGPGSELTWLALGALAGAAAYAFDDPSGDVTDSVPVSVRRRAGARLLAAVVAWSLWGAYAVAVVAGTPAAVRPSWTALAVTGAGLILAAGASAAVLRRRGTPEPGSLVASAVLVLVLALMLIGLPFDLAVFDVSASRTGATDLWTVVGVIGVLLLVWSTSDQRGWARVSENRQAAPAGPAGRAGSGCGGG